ncbi:MAG: ATP-binding protein, partial [Thermoguttaceae bacterium]
MFGLADWPIRRKLGLLTASGALVALMLACTAFTIRDVRAIRAAKEKQIVALADILGSNATAALEFHDAGTAAEVLASLRLQPSIELAALFDDDGKLVATYPAKLPEGHTLPANPAATGGPLLGEQHLTIAQDIRRDGERVGTIYLLSNLLEVNEQFAQSIWIAIGVMIVALAISMVVTGWLGRVFTAPIKELAEAMEHISTEGDYSLQVKKYGRDELGVLCDGFNTMLGQIEVSHDELEERVAQRTKELQVALQAAEAGNRAKSDFLANMSHELRTPMTAILGFAEVLQHEFNCCTVCPQHESCEIRRTSNRHIGTICSNGHHLLRLVNDILDLSKIEAGKMKTDRKDCSPWEIVEDVVSSLAIRAKGKGLSLRVDYVFPLPGTIKTDPLRLRQILVNLVGNAIKFTERGGIRIEVRHTQQPGGGSRIHFAVADSGIGIAPKHLDDVFQAFTQADTSASRCFGGTGLGLTISQRLAETLDGNIQVKSQPGKGSTFTLTIDPGSLDGVPMLDALPKPSFKKKESPAASQLPTLSGRVLLAEDGPDNQRLIGFLLKKAGLEVDLADNGLIAYEKALASQSQGKPYDLILMDMQMPELDGYAATRQLRDHG